MGVLQADGSLRSDLVLQNKRRLLHGFRVWYTKCDSKNPRVTVHVKHHSQQWRNVVHKILSTCALLVTPETAYSPPIWYLRPIPIRHDWPVNYGQRALLTVFLKYHSFADSKQNDVPETFCLQVQHKKTHQHFILHISLLTRTYILIIGIQKKKCHFQ